MRKKSSIVFLFLLIHLASIGQMRKMDSLLKQLAIAKEDTTIVKLYLDIGDLYEGSDPVKAKEYYRKAVDLSTKSNFRTGIVRSLIYYSAVFSVTGEFDSALIYNNRALTLAREMKDSLNIGIALLNIGITHGHLSDFETAVRYCLEGLNVIEGKAYDKIELQINDRLQVLYWQMTQYDKAIEFGQKAVQQSRQLNMPVYLAQSLTNLATNYLSKKMWEKARPLLLDALEISKSIGSIYLEGTILINLAGISYESADYNTMKLYSERSLLLHRQLGSSNGEALSLRALAIYYLHKKDFTSAKKHAEESMVISKKNNYKAEYAGALRILSNIDFATGDLQSGEKHNSRSEDILKEMIADILSEKSANLEKKYETGKKEMQIKQLTAEKKVQLLSISQKNTLNYILIGSAVAVFVISLLFYRNYKHKQKLQQQRIIELEKEKQLTATEAILKGEEQERTRLAKDLHDGLGGMMSGIKYSLLTMKRNQIMTPENQQAFERSMDMLDSSINEMRRVAHNMMPEALVKFGLDTALGDLCNDINQTGALQVSYQSIGIKDENFEQTTSITIYRIIQELINNTMKHAAAKTAIVQITKTNSTISITVEDDGKGFNTAILQGAKGIGWNNIQSRVGYLKGKLDVRSQPGNGTSVHIELNT